MFKIVKVKMWSTTSTESVTTLEAWVVVITQHTVRIPSIKNGMNLTIHASAKPAILSPLPHMSFSTRDADFFMQRDNNVSLYIN